MIEISDNDTFGYIVAEDTRFQMGGTSSLSANNLTVRTDSGRVGIGTTSPTLGKLHISGSGTNANYSILAQTTSSVNYMKFANSSTGITSGDGFDIGANGTTAYLLNRENANMIFSTNDTERMRILAARNIVIWTTSPTKQLQVKGDKSASRNIRDG